MGQIQDLEHRIAAAFARISAGVDAMSERIATTLYDGPKHSDLSVGSGMPQAELDEAHMANAQLNERIAVLQRQAAASERDLEGQVETLTRHLDAQGLDLQRLSGTVAQLREDLRRLREAAVQGIVDPSLINRAMMAELEALRATRSAEANEMNDILSALAPILEAEEARAHA